MIGIRAVRLVVVFVAAYGTVSKDRLMHLADGRLPVGRKHILIINIDDVTLLINYLLNNDAVQINQANADIDSDGAINISDVTMLIQKLLNQH